MSLASGLLTQVQVVYALVLRETRTKFGEHQLGYLWALIEPVLWILTFVAMFAFLSRTCPAGMDLFGFLATGLVPFGLFARTADVVSEAINGNTTLLVYRQVKPTDLVIARAVLEAVTQVTVFFILFGAQAIVVGKVAVDEPLILIAGFLASSALGASFGYLCCALGVVWPTVGRIRGVVMTPLFWVSAVFFAANEVPPQLSSIIKWNPVMHGVELVRSGWFPGYESRVADFGYAMIWIVAMSFVGLTVERAVRHRVEIG